MTAATANRTDWLDGLTASKTMGVSPPFLQKNAARWGIRVRRWEGRKGELYNAADVDKCLARMEAEENARIAAARCAGTDGAPVVRKSNEAARPR